MQKWSSVNGKKHFETQTEGDLLERSVAMQVQIDHSSEMLDQVRAQATYKINEMQNRFRQQQYGQDQKDAAHNEIMRQEM